MFNLEKEQTEPWAAGKLLSGENRIKAGIEILYMNSFIDKARELYPKIPRMLIKAEQLVFSPKGKPPTKDYVWVKEEGRTPTGKEPKYVQTLFFWSKYREAQGEYNPLQNEVFGDISYYANGQIGKAQIVIWGKSVGYAISCGRKKGGDLCVIGIDTMIDGYKEKVYRCQ